MTPREKYAQGRIDGARDAHAGLPKARCVEGDPYWRGYRHGYDGHVRAVDDFLAAPDREGVPTETWPSAEVQELW